MPSLPIVGGDAGAWGGELNTWLLVEHNADGTLKLKPVNPGEIVTAGNAGAVVVKSAAFNVLAYGATGDGTTSDSAAFQAAVNAAVAAKGKLLIPAPSVNYNLTTTVTIQPQAGQTYAYMDVEMEGEDGDIFWNGASGSPVFHTFNWKYSTVEGVRISLNTQNNVACWEMDATSLLNSTGFLTFTNCLCSLGSGTANRGWRLGYPSSAYDFSFLNWQSCKVAGATNTSSTNGHVGWHNLSSNGLNLQLINCGVLDCSHIYSNSVFNTTTSGSTAIGAATITVFSTLGFATTGQLTVGAQTISYTGITGTTFTGVTGVTSIIASSSLVEQYPGSGVTQGGPATTFVGCGSTRSFCDYILDTGGAYAIAGGRYEVGKRFVRAAVPSSYSISLDVSGVTLATYAPTDGVVFALGAAVALKITGSAFYGTDYTAAFITAGNFDGWGGAGANGVISVEDTMIRTTATKPWTLPTSWRYRAHGVQTGNASNAPTGFAASQPGAYSGFLTTPGLFVESSTLVSTALTTGLTYFQYLGRLNQPETTIDLVFNVTTAAATITWAEVALFKGTPVANGNASLTLVTFADVSAVFNSITTPRKKVTLTVTGLLPFDDLWVAFGSSATTPFQVRGMAADDLQSGVVQTATVRPSLAASPQATTLAGATLVPAWVVARA